MILILNFLLGLLGPIPLPRMPHPLPDGHVYRDVQVTASDGSLQLDVSLKASDNTWIALLERADREWQQQIDDPPALDNHRSANQSANTDTPPSSDTDSSGKTNDSARNELHQRVDRDSHLPLPTNEDEVAEWLTNPDNRHLLEWWIAKHSAAELGNAALSLESSAKSRQNSRHHWAINIQLHFALPDPQKSEKLAVTIDAFQDYPGMVRRAIKARGDLFLANSELAAAVVRADFEPRTEKQSREERRERIEATLQF